MKAPRANNTKTAPLQSFPQRQQGRGDRQSDSFTDNRPQAHEQTTIQQLADASPRGGEIAQLQALTENERPNRTGLPDSLKAGIENLSGYSLDDVRVHYNSDKPATLQAHAYAQGTNIHLASGQEKHLPHEAWHVVQQKQGRVRPTIQLKGKVRVNDDVGLEREADLMGARAIGINSSSAIGAMQPRALDYSNVNDGAIQCQTIMQPGYATGDMFGIVATLIDNEDAHVVISRGEDNDPTDRANVIRQFYLDSGISDDRIHIVDVRVLRKGGGGLRNKALWVEETKLLNRKTKTKIKEDDIKSVSGGTEYVAEKFTDETRNKLKTAWNVNDTKDAEIETWLAGKGVPSKGGNVAILWSRFSGKKGDIHLEHDSSYTGIEQLAVAAAQHYDAVIIAGDKGHSPAKGGKYDLITARINTKLNAGKVFNLTEFWTDDSDSLRAWGGNTRLGQLKLYDYLHRNFQESKHLGFRSGNLEVMAMLGYQVRYMEEPNSAGGDRMMAWHHHAEGKTKAGGVATGYERLGVFEPPTRSGKYLKTHPAEDKRPNWAPGRAVPSKPSKPNEISSLPKGFGELDMEAIMAYLKPAKDKEMAQHLVPHVGPLFAMPEIRLAFGNAFTLMGLVPHSNSLASVDSAFRKLALKYHPDKKGGDQAKFVLLNQAKNILKGDLSSIAGFNAKIWAIESSPDNTES